MLPTNQDADLDYLIHFIGKRLVVTYSYFVFFFSFMDSILKHWKNMYFDGCSGFKQYFTKSPNPMIKLTEFIF